MNFTHSAVATAPGRGLKLCKSGSRAGCHGNPGGPPRGDVYMRALLRYGGNRRALRAFAERQELVKAGLTRRDLVRLGLMAGGGAGGGLLVTEKGMAADLRSNDALGQLPPLAKFVEPLPILPVLPERDPATDPSFVAHPSTAAPNRATNPATGLPFEGRSEPHQSRGPGQPGAF